MGNPFPITIAKPNASKTLMRASSGRQVLRFLGIPFVRTGKISASRSATSYLLFPRREGIANPKAGDPLHSHAALQGTALYRCDLPTRSLAAAGALGRQILKHEHVWLVVGEKFVHLANKPPALIRDSLRSPIHEKRRNFENREGETP